MENFSGDIECLVKNIFDDLTKIFEKSIDRLLLSENIIDSSNRMKQSNYFIEKEIT